MNDTIKLEMTIKEFALLAYALASVRDKLHKMKHGWGVPASDEVGAASSAWFDDKNERISALQNKLIAQADKQNPNWDVEI
jgi:hypothetical protein